MKEANHASFLFLPGRYGRRLQYRSHTIVYCGVGSGVCVRWMRTKARHATISFELVEWSERLTSVLVISVWLGAAAVGFESDSAPAGVE